MKIDALEILETFTDRFKKHWWNKEDIDDIKGFTFSDKDDDFTEAIRSFLDTINVKNRHLDIKGIEFKTLSVNLKTDRTILSVDAGDGFGEVERWMKIDVKWWMKGRKGTTLTLTRTRNSDAIALKFMLGVTNYYVEEFMKGTLTKAMIMEFIKSSPDEEVEPELVSPANKKNKNILSKEVKNPMITSDCTVNTGLIKVPAPVPSPAALPPPGPAPRRACAWCSGSA